MEQAVIDNSNETRDEYIGRQALNGYASIYKEEWVVGKNKEGIIAKTNGDLLFEILDDDKQKRNERINYTQNHALFGTDLRGEKFCKFTYDVKDQKKYSIHVELVKEYKENEVMVDSGHYGGIHFVPLEHIEICLEHTNTYYGNKIVLVEPIEEEVYYEYMSDVFVGKKVFISRVMKLDNVDTWKELSNMTESIRKNKEKICDYLSDLSIIDSTSYEKSIEYVNGL